MRLLSIVFAFGPGTDEGMDMEQYRQVFDEHFDSLRNFLYYKLGDSQMAEEGFGRGIVGTASLARN